MRVILFRCPVKALKVQWVDCDGRPQDESAAHYRVIVCPACSRLHFADEFTGELVEEN
jgi:hypothetical protein